MIAAVDVHYKTDYAKAVAVLFKADDLTPQQVITERIDEVAAYIPGQFYKRELPCLLKVIEKLDPELIEIIIVDGHVYTDNQKQFGLGGKLWEALKEKTPVIGVAKTPFLSNKDTVAEVASGESKNPLYISAIGIDINEAALLVKNLKGSYRIPDILKTLDRITKEV